MKDTTLHSLYLAIVSLLLFGLIYLIVERRAERVRLDLGLEEYECYEVGDTLYPNYPVTDTVIVTQPFSDLDLALATDLTDGEMADFLKAHTKPLNNK